MKKTLTILTALYFLSGCGKDKSAVEQSEDIFNYGTPKILKVNLSQDGIGSGPQIRFYDTDGDGKTVEQYLELYTMNSGYPNNSEAKINLLRPGAKNNYGSENTAKEMTAEQMNKLDSIYQNLLESEKNGFLR